MKSSIKCCVFVCFWKCFVNCKHLTVFNKNLSKNHSSHIRLDFIRIGWMEKFLVKLKNVFRNFICVFAFTAVGFFSSACSLQFFVIENAAHHHDSWNIQKINETTRERSIKWSQLKMCMHNIWIDISFLSTNTRRDFLVGWQRTATTTYNYQLSLL